MKTLVLTLQYPTRSSYYEDWCDAFRHSPHFAATVRNVFDPSARREVRREITRYELIVALHSCTADTLDYVDDLATALQGRRGILVSFVGNEVNLPWMPLGDKIAWLRRAAPDVIATQLLAEAGTWLYADVGTRVVAMPHALNPAAFRPVLPQSKRTIDVGIRAYRYLAHLGDDDRNRLHDYFTANPFVPRLAVDASFDQRLDRAGWADFLNRCKATVSTEAGSFYLERDDRTVLAIRDHAAKAAKGIVLRADSLPARLARGLPYRVKSLLRRVLRGSLLSYEATAAEALDFAEIHGRFFAGRARAPVYSKAISSRHFDAVGCKTLQIMFPGRYNDILVAGEHYVALAPDFSNIAEVLELLRDVRARERIVERAYDHVMARHTYACRLASLARTLETAAAA
jgi:spore maturation protein CgeB